MIPQDDWMELKLWAPQQDQLSVRVILPEGIDKADDPAAVFEVVKMGPLKHEHKNVKVGDVVIMYGMGAIAKLKLPSDRKTVVGRLCDVAFVVEKEDLYGDNSK